MNEIITEAIETGTIQSIDDSPITIDELDSVLELLERTFNDVEFELYDKTQLEYDEITRIDQITDELSAKADVINKEVADLHALLGDPSSGLLHKFDEFQDKKTAVNNELTSEQLKNDVLKRLKQISLLLDQFNSSFEAGNYLLATGTIDQLKILIETFIDYQHTTTVSNLLGEYNSKQTALAQKLTATLQGSFKYSINDTTVSFLFDPQKTMLQAVFLNDHLTGILQQELRKLLHEFLIPLTQTFPINLLFQDISNVLVALILEFKKESAHEEFIDLLNSVLLPTLLQSITSRLWTELPSQSSELEEFKIKMKNTVSGFISSITEHDGNAKLENLTTWIERIHHHFTRKLRNSIFKKVKSLIADSTLGAYEILDVGLPLDEMEVYPGQKIKIDIKSGNNGDEPVRFFRFPKCAVSVSTLEIVTLLDTLHAEILKVNQVESTDIHHDTTHNIRDILDFILVNYRFVHSSDLEDVKKSVVMVHDMFYLAHYCTVFDIMSSHEGTPESLTLASLAHEFRGLSHQFFDLSVTRQYRSLREYLNLQNDPNGLESKLSRIPHEIERIESDLEDVTTPHLKLKYLGGLLSKLHRKLILEILKLTDISVNEAERMYKDLQSIYPLEDIFGAVETLDHYVPTKQMFHEAIEILDMKLMDILENFQRGRAMLQNYHPNKSSGLAKVPFKNWTGLQISGLVRALFSDTPNRLKVLEALEQDQHVPDFDLNQIGGDDDEELNKMSPHSMHLKDVISSSLSTFVDVGKSTTSVAVGMLKNYSEIRENLREGIRKMDSTDLVSLTRNVGEKILGRFHG